MAVGSASAAAPEYVSSFGQDGTSATGFGHAAAIAVDQENHWVYVLDYVDDTVSRFDLNGDPVPFSGSAPYLSGNQITELSLPNGAQTTQVAVDSTSHRLYVTSGNAVRAFEADGEPAEFSAGPGAGTSEITGFTSLKGVAVDETGFIYASDNNSTPAENIKVFAASGAEVTHAGIGTQTPGNLAIDNNGALYVKGTFGRLLKLVPSEYPVTADTDYSGPETFDPRPSYAVAVDPVTNDVYVAENGEEPGEEPRIVQFNEAGTLLTTFAGEGEEGEAEQSEGIGIDADSTRVFISNFPASGLSQVEIFQPVVAAPTIERVFVSEITADSARLAADINPNTRDTEFYFEYGPDDCSLSDCTKVPATGGTIGDGHRAVSVSQNIVGLTAQSVYHFRAIAVNDLGESISPDQIFTTQGLGRDVTLSDSRVWELVSPSNKLGGILIIPSGGPIQAAEDGDGLVFQTLGSIESDSEGNRAIERSTVLAGRGGGGWTSRDLTPPHLEPTRPAGIGSEYDAFNRDLSVAALEPRDDNPLSPFASSKTPYLRLNAEPHTFVPLVSSKEGHANVPPGTEFGKFGEEIFVSGMSSELDHVVLRSDAPLVPGGQRQSLYAWSGGSLQTVSALPAGEEGGAVVAGILGSAKGSTRHAISEDGTRVFWGQGSYDAAGINTTALYMRNLNSEQTVRLDAVQAGATGAGEAKPVFQGANADGSVVFFSDSRQLTEDASPEGRDLYRCELIGPEPEECDLTNITSPRSQPGESAEHLGLVSALSENGSRVYFVAEGVLSTEPNEEGSTAESGDPNLYLWEEGEGVRYIATLSRQDRPDWGVNGDSNAFSFWLSTAVSPSGRYLTFMSELSLTGYDNRDASGVRAEEIFLYDASTEELRCASCNPSGGAPKALEIHTHAGFAMVDPQDLWQDTPLAAVMPQARGFGAFEYSTYRPRTVLNNGRLFFNAADSLVSADSNGMWDVYQYEPFGLGSCSSTSGSATSARTENACIDLITSGTGDSEAAFLDASVTGDDVFFLTPARLSALDTDTVYDAYDARVNGTVATIDPVTECAGEACQPLVAPPNDPTPASEAFRGPGNLKQCPKGKRKVKRKGHVRCVPHKKKKHKKAGQSRRADR
jgi:hypothetical protein